MVDKAPDPAGAGLTVFRGSRLLESISEADRGTLRAHTSRVVLRRGDVLFQPSEDVTTVHFPCGGTTISMVVVQPEPRWPKPGSLVAKEPSGRS